MLFAPWKLSVKVMELAGDMFWWNFREQDGKQWKDALINMQWGEDLRSATLFCWGRQWKYQEAEKIRL